MSCGCGATKLGFCVICHTEAAVDDRVRTWTDIERRALFCPVLARMRHLIKQHPDQRDAVVIGTLLFFSEERERLLNAETLRRGFGVR